MKYSSPKISYKQSQILLLYAWLLIILLWSITTAQIKDMQFKHLTIDDGLSSSWVRCIIQDKYGFMWFGTEAGLNCYDGNSVHVYKNNLRDKCSIVNNYVMSILEDSRGDLWIGTRQGLDLYDRKNNRFIRYPDLAQATVTSIAEDKDKNLWVGTYFELCYINLRNDNINFYSTDSIWGNNQHNSGVTALLIDSRENVWIGSSYGLHLYSKDENSFVNYLHNEDDPNSLCNNTIRSIFEDKDGRLWIGTRQGLDLFTNAHERPQKGIFIHHQNNIHDNKSISQGTIMSLIQDDKHNLLIGIENGGLDMLNLAAYKEGVNSFVHFKHDPDRNTSLSNNSIYSLFQDKQGNIWIGTFGNGINIVNPINDKFIHFKKEPGSKNSLNNNQVNVFWEENDFLWIGTEGGLNRYNKKDGTFKHYIHDPLNNKSIGSDAVWAICKDKRGSLWVGTWGGGLNKFNYRTETFEHYYNNPKDTTTIGSNNIFSIIEDSRGILWIGTMGNGLNIFDREKKKFTRYNISNSGIYNNYVQLIIETKDGDLWFANTSSFEHYSRKTKTFEHYSHNPNDSTSLKSINVISIFEDSKGNLWMGTDNGLHLLNKSTKGFICYQIEDGLPDNSINSILEDNHGNLWLSTNKGLSKFINAINLPAKPQFRNYTYDDGLQSNGFVQRSCYKNTNGMLYFGGVNGFNVFDPDKIKDNTYIPPIVITDFQVFNKSVPLGDRGYESEIGKAEDLVLSYTQSVFSFDFAALNYISSSKNQYAYKMEGFDKEWNYIGTTHTVTYTNLDPGRYIFKVKGSNNDGVWNEESISLPIVITPPFWQTLWFRLILISVISGIFFWIYKWRMQLRELATEKRIDAALTKERNLLRTLIDLIPDYIYLKDTESRFILANKALIQSFGKETIDEICGKTDFDFHPLENARVYFADEREIIRSGQALLSKEEPVVEATGQRKWNISTKIPFRDLQGKVVGLVGIGRDITARKHVEEDRDRLITELQNALADVKLLSGLVPICAKCKKIRDDQGYWTQIESYIQDRSDAKFSHSICPDCAAKLYPDYNLKK